MPVELAGGCKDNCLGRHIEADRERLRRKENFDCTFLEQDLNDFLQNGKQAPVVDANSPTEQRKYIFDLRKRAVGRCESCDGIGEDFLDCGLFVCAIELKL